VNSYVRCTITTSDYCYFIGSFPSSEFPWVFLVERFLVTCARETLINEWDDRWTMISEGAHSLGWEVERKRDGGKSR
jgi:hypothetical protein